MTTVSFRTLVAIGTMVSVLVSGNALAVEMVKIHGGSASIRALEKKHADIEKASGSKVELKFTSADTATIAFLKGFIDGIAVGITLEETLAAAEKKAGVKSNVADFQTVEVARQVIPVGLNPQNPTKSLTRQQLADILAGKITSWEPINGVKEPVKVYFSSTLLGVNKEIFNTYGDGKPSSVAHFATTNEGLMANVKKDVGAIGFFSGKIEVDGFKPTYFESEAGFPIILIARKATTEKMQKIFDFYRSLKK